MLHTPLETVAAVRCVDAAPDPLTAFETLRGRGHAWLLESALRGPRLGRASFLGAAPYAVVRVRGRRVDLEVLRDADPRWPVGHHGLEGDPLALLRSLMPPGPRGPAPDLPFVGGAIGYLGYELAQQLDVHRLHGRDDLGLPDGVLLLVDRVLAFDHEKGRVVACGLGMDATPVSAAARAEAALLAMEQALASRSDMPPFVPRVPDVPVATDVTDVTDGMGDAEDACIDPAAYAKAVDEVKQEIVAGRVYQACLTARACRRFDADPWQLYRTLRRLNPAPFACFLELPEVAVVGSSPERFLRVTRDGVAESRPIKGTTARGRDPLEDAAQRSALEHSEKDRAENLMIVDLVRNDLGRVCQVGSVHVPELMAIESYASVFQMVSTVCGKLAAGKDVFDALRASFPPGSMTGAPKIAAMALLDRLEPVRRTVYSGAVGYFDAFGGADLSVVIRTALVKDGRAWLHAGGGVVADSEPVAEYDEAMDKLRPLLGAIDETLGSAG